MKLRNAANSLFVSVVNVVLVAISFLFLIFPRFTNLAQLVGWLIFLLVAIDVVLVVRDLSRRGTRARAFAAVALWLPILFLASMINQWEGPLYLSANGNPPVFDVRGAASFCGLEIYSPEHDRAEWQDDDIGLVWRIDHSPSRPLPVTAKFTYGEVPPQFVQRTPAAPALDPALTYTVIAERCMGGAQYFSLRRLSLSEYEASSNVCWGDLNVPQRHVPAHVRVDCKTHEALPMSSRAQRRLEAYRENRIPFY